MSRSMASLVADSLGATRMPWSRSTRHVPTVRRSCQPRPGPTGSPLARSHTMVEARWLAIPTPATGPARVERGAGHLEHRPGHGHGVEFHEPGRGEEGSTSM